MIVIVAIGIRNSSLNSRFSYFRCMKNQSTRPAFDGGDQEVDGHAPVSHCISAAMIVIPVRTSSAIQTRIKSGQGYV